MGNPTDKECFNFLCPGLLIYKNDLRWKEKGKDGRDPRMCCRRVSRAEKQTLYTPDPPTETWAVGAVKSLGLHWHYTERKTDEAELKLPPRQISVSTCTPAWAHCLRLNTQWASRELPTISRKQKCELVCKHTQEARNVRQENTYRILFWRLTIGNKF